MGDNVRAPAAAWSTGTGIVQDRQSGRPVALAGWAVVPGLSLGTLAVVAATVRCAQALGPAKINTYWAISQQPRAGESP